jgi:hypothetical protein
VLAMVRPRDPVAILGLQVRERRARLSHSDLSVAARDGWVLSDPAAGPVRLTEFSGSGQGVASRSSPDS